MISMAGRESGDADPRGDHGPGLAKQDSSPRVTALAQPMTTLSSIPGIGNSSLELLEAVGFLNVDALAKAGVDELAMEIERANRILQIARNTPDRSHIEGWISSARELSELADKIAAEVAMQANGEPPGEADTMLGGAPAAMRDREMNAGGILPDRDSGDFEVSGEDRAPSDRPAVSVNHIKIAEPGENRLEIDVTRIKSTDALAGSRRMIASKMAMADERVALIRTPRPETNQGRDPQSRNYIRGVLHSRPVSLVVGAAFTLLLAVVLPLAIISAGLLLLSGEMPEQFGWVPEWLLVFPCVLPVFGIAYLIWGMHGGCRVCGQKLFVPRLCLKNSKAHHIHGLGHIIPVCLHILLFKWFRCTYCGTPIRLKK